MLSEISGNKRAREILENEKRLRNGKCEVCGSVEQLEFHHLFPTGVSGVGRGMKIRAYDIKRNNIYFKLLCKKCHVKLERKKGFNRGVKNR